jgi:hypothetical protein
VLKQRDALMKKMRALSESNKHVNNERFADFRGLTKQNAELILEMNRLKGEKKSFETRVSQLESVSGGGMSGGMSFNKSMPTLQNSQLGRRKMLYFALHTRNCIPLFSTAPERILTSFKMHPLRNFPSKGTLALLSPS